MKKTAAVLLSLILLILTASCSKVSTPSSTASAPLVTDKTITREFKDSNGKVVSELDATYPVLSGSIDETVNEKIDSVITAYIENISAQLEKDTDNVSETLDRFELEGPEITRITYETYDIDSVFFSFIFSIVKSTNPDETEPDYRGFSFSLRDGEQLSVSRLAVSDRDETLEKVKEAVSASAQLTYSSNQMSLDDEKLELIQSCFSEDNMVTDGTVLYFVFSYNLLSSGQKTGIYLLPIDPGDEILDGCLTSPELYGA